MSANQKTFASDVMKVLDLLEVDQEESKKIETFIHDQELKQLFLQLIQKEQRYVRQLLVNLPPEDQGIRRTNTNNNHKIKISGFSCKEELFEKCKKKEKGIEKIYREAMDACKLQEKLRRTMQEQLNEFKILFLRIRINYMIKSKLISPYDLRKIYK